MSDVQENQFIETFRQIFPEYSEQLDKATDEDAIEALLETITSQAEADIEQHLSSIKLSKTKVKHAAAIYLSPWRYQRLVKATGDQLKNELLDLINSLQALKKKQHAPAKEFASAMVTAGVPAVPPITIPATPKPPLYVEAMEAGAPELTIAEESLSTTPPGLVIAIIVLVIIAILVLIWFLTKPSNCIILLINETDKLIKFAGDYNVHGEPQTVTPYIPAAVQNKNDQQYRAAGFFVSKRKTGFRGTQYGFRMSHPIGHLAFGACCPLTTAGGPNSCFCHVGGTAEHAAIDTDKHRKQFYEDEHNSHVKTSIRCNSASGSPAYYVARVFD
jgi:hypothetical protein